MRGVHLPHSGVRCVEVRSPSVEGVIPGGFLSGITPRLVRDVILYVISLLSKVRDSSSLDVLKVIAVIQGKVRRVLAYPAILGGQDSKLQLGLRRDPLDLDVE